MSHNACITMPTEGLRHTAEVWRAQADQLGVTRELVEGMRVDRIEMGLFQLFHAPYRVVLDQVGSRLTEGSQSFRHVADNLLATANKYDADEARHGQLTRGCR